jgi:demethylmenaquinone methyltransferase/2-methoxy-6-polyprenyl-1,4-benzoquinol methylase
MTNHSQIQGLFDRIAPVYDRLNDRLSFGMHRIWKQMAIKWCKATAGDTCLDLCCGSGDLALQLAERVGDRGKVYAVDFSTQLLAVGKQRCIDRYPLSLIEWIEADALQLPFADNTFDAATMGYGLRNLTDIPQGVRELHRVLKPNASAAILDFHRPQSPLMRSFQQWYLDYWVVPIATELGFTEEYAYLSPSLDRFPSGREQVVIAQTVGFARATHYSIAGGMMGVLVVTK